MRMKRRTALAVCCALSLAMAVVMFDPGPALAASKNVDLDGNGSTESIVDLTVISSYPAKVKCKITNKSSSPFTFSWPSAGPGGFTSSLVAGSSSGKGTIWDWQTGQAIYSYTGSICEKDICFTNSTTGASSGPFKVPGRSLSRTDVTYSSASLTSSLISFFSPPQVEVSVTSAFGPTADEGLVFKNVYTNKTPLDITLEFAPVPEGCCLEPSQLYCVTTESCVNYLEDVNNCGSCGNACATGEACNNGSCEPVCGSPEAWMLCADGANNPVCTSYTTDPSNCGGCGNVCAAGATCVSGACIPGVTLGTYAPVPPGTPAAECVFDGFTADLGPSESLAKWECSPVLVKATEADTSLTVVSPVDEDPRDGIADLDQDGSVKIKVSTGTFVELIPSSVPIGDVSPSIALVELVHEPSGDGLLQPGETGRFEVTVNNIGPLPLTNVSGVLSAPPFNAADFAQPGIVVDPLPDLTIGVGSSPYGMLSGYSPSSCDASGVNFSPPGPTAPSIDGALLPTSANSVLFEVTVPSNHPGDVAREFNLALSGKIDGLTDASFEIPFALGIAGKCDPTLGNGDYDQIDGLLSPMAKLVPADEGYTIPYPSKSFGSNKTRPLKLRQLCGGVELLGSQIATPEIVRLTRKVGDGERVDIPLSEIINEDTGTPDPFFRFSDTGKQWIYNLRTSNLGPGDYIITIEIADEKNYVTGFVLN